MYRVHSFQIPDTLHTCTDLIFSHSMYMYVDTCTDISKHRSIIYFANQTNPFHTTMYHLIIIMHTRFLIILTFIYSGQGAGLHKPLDHFFPFRFRHPVHHRRPANSPGESLPVRLTKAPSHSSLIDAEERKKKSNKEKREKRATMFSLCRICVGMRPKC